jgi:hypothetical protein
MRHVSLSFSDPFLAAAAVGYKKNEPMYTERCTDSNFWYSTGADMLFSKSRSRRKRMPQRAEYANLPNRDNDRFVRAHIHTKNFLPETECRLMRSLTETGGESGGDLRRTPRQNLLQNRKEKKKLSKGKHSLGTEREPARSSTETTEER